MLHSSVLHGIKFDVTFVFCKIVYISGQVECEKVRFSATRIGCFSEISFCEFASAVKNAKEF
jgi:hypothetical protein